MFSPRLLAGLLCLFSGTAQIFAQSASCTYTFFNTPSQFVATFIKGINLYGNVVGTACGTENPNGCVGDRGYIRYSDGSTKILLAPNSNDTQFNRRNASGVTVGQMGNSKGTHGVVYYNGTWRSVDFPGATATTLTGINKYGTIVGNWTDGNGHSHAFRLKNGTFTQLKTSGASDIYAESISDTGAIVGWYANSSAAVYINGFVWQTGVLRTF